MRNRPPVDSRSLVRHFTHKGITLRYIGLDVGLDFFNLDFSRVVYAQDDALLRERDWRFARILALHPKEDERLYTAWRRAMCEDNDLVPTVLVHPALQEALTAAPEDLHRWLRIIRTSSLMGNREKPA